MCFSRRIILICQTSVSRPPPFPSCSFRHPFVFSRSGFSHPLSRNTIFKPFSAFSTCIALHTSKDDVREETRRKESKRYNN